MSIDFPGHPLCYNSHIYLNYKLPISSGSTTYYTSVVLPTSLQKVLTGGVERVSAITAFNMWNDNNDINYVEFYVDIDLHTANVFKKVYT